MRRYSHEDAIEKWLSREEFELEFPQGTPAQVSQYLGALALAVMDAESSGGLQAIDYRKAGEIKATGGDIVDAPRGVVAAFRRRQLIDLMADVSAATSSPHHISWWFACRVQNLTFEAVGDASDKHKSTVARGVGIVDGHIMDALDARNWRL